MTMIDGKAGHMDDDERSVFKSKYTFTEFWGELTQGSLYKKYAAADPVESTRIAAIAQKKMAQEPYFMPNNIATTHTGKAIVMMINTLSA